MTHDHYSFRILWCFLNTCDLNKTLRKLPNQFFKISWDELFFRVTYFRISKYNMGAFSYHVTLKKEGWKEEELKEDGLKGEGLKGEGLKGEELKRKRWNILKLLKLFCYFATHWGREKEGRKPKKWQYIQTLPDFDFFFFYRQRKQMATHFTISTRQLTMLMKLMLSYRW